MRVLLVHNRYHEPGGEDAVVRSEYEMLQKYGADVTLHEGNNEEAHGGLRSKVRVGLSAAWSKRTYDDVSKLCRDLRPDVVHVHNFWVSLSPSIHTACRDAGIPSVQTLHNYRLICLNSILMRNGRPCEDCIGNLPWRGVARKCYRQSAAASSLVASMVIVNNWRRTWHDDVSVFITLTALARQRYVRGGLPAESIVVKPNFVEDWRNRDSVTPGGCRDILYAGRVAPEKGVDVLLKAWARQASGGQDRLVIAGDGPALSAVQNLASTLNLNDRVVFLGHRSSETIRDMMNRCRAVVIPSLCYEMFPRTVVEAYSCGRPVIASAHGALDELVEHNVTGVKFRPGDAGDLARCLSLIRECPGPAERLGRAGRAVYESQYTPRKNYEALMEVYRVAAARGGKAAIPYAAQERVLEA